jgi:hypothetical protein
MATFSDDGDGYGVQGSSTKGAGVRGISATNFGVHGVHPEPSGITAPTGAGVAGEASKGAGLLGTSTSHHGVHGINGARSGVTAPAAAGVIGESRTGDGVFGSSLRRIGVEGASTHGTGVFGWSQDGEGLHGETHSKKVAAVAAINANPSSTSAALYAEHKGPGPAALVRGNLEVTGDVILQGADYAEELTVSSADVAPGMVVVLEDDGRIRPCTQEYDARVAGIVSGAGGVRPALVLDRHDDGAPVALMGKLWVWADASTEPIRCGDMLTTSATPGHARRVVDRDRAFGAVVGKALTDLASDRGLIRALVSPS